MTYAYCDATGVIKFGDFVPDSSLEIMQGDDKLVRNTMVSIARHAYDGVTLLVPGIPEAKDQNEGIDALIKFKQWIKDRQPKKAKKP